MHIMDHANNFDAVAQTEWISVIKQIQAFVDADSVCTILNADSSPVVVSARLTQYTCPPIDTVSNARSLELSEIIIVGNTFDQVKFSEITIDMFRILQCVERDPKDFSRRTSVALFPQKSFENGDGYELPFPSPNLSDKKFRNPHKYLLYKPSFSLFNTFMATGFKDLPSDGVLLLYISADGLTWSENVAHPECKSILSIYIPMTILTPHFLDRNFPIILNIPRSSLLKPRFIVVLLRLNDHYDI